MAAPKRSEMELYTTRETITALLLEGHTQSEIAKKLHMTASMVSYDMHVIIEEWRKKTAINIDQIKIKELDKIDHREKEAWEAWHKSKEEVKKHTKITRKGDVQTIETIETKCGDPRYLEAIARCSKDRRELLGMDAPNRSEVAAIVVSAKLPDGIDPSSV